MYGGLAQTFPSHPPSWTSSYGCVCAVTQIQFVVLYPGVSNKVTNVCRGSFGLGSSLSSYSTTPPVASEINIGIIDTAFYRSDEPLISCGNGPTVGQ